MKATESIYNVMYWAPFRSYTFICTMLHTVGVHFQNALCAKFNILSF
jgi:hypothetical protein